MTAEPIDERLGEAVRTLRARRGLSTRALAALAGVSQPLVSKVENGSTRPSVPTLYALAEALGVGPADLLPPTDGGPIPAGHGVPLPLSETGDLPAITTRLLHAAPGGRIEAYRVEHAAGHRDAAPFRHSGEDIVHLLEGRVTLHCGGIRLELEAGDTVWIDGTSPHFFETPPDSAAAAIIVTARSAQPR
jgi:transcriptional regulator with XRE-family HTH domain